MRLITKSEIIEFYFMYPHVIVRYYMCIHESGFRFICILLQKYSHRYWIEIRGLHSDKDLFLFLKRKQLRLKIL
jgi:hypothetical protein